MTKKDIAELKRRLKKEDCTFTRLCGCYVDGQKNIVLQFHETFLNLRDEELHKYLEIAKKLLSGTVGNNLLELSFLAGEENPGGKQQYLLGLRESKLKNDDLLLRLYELIIEHYDYTGNYLILVFHDAYDVITKTSDNEKLDESEEVYEYLLCAICPVELTKPGLGYREDENRFGARIRDWIVTVPETGFVFPAFTDRSSDIHAMMYYTKNAKASHPELIASAFGCQPKRTAAEEKTTFQEIIQNALGEEEKANDVFIELQENLNSLIESRDTALEKEPVRLTNDTIQEIVADSGLPEEIAAEIQQSCLEVFGDTPPEAKNLIDTKALAANAKKKKEQALQWELHTLKQQLEETGASPASDAPDAEAAASAPEAKPFDIVLQVKPEKVPQIKSQIVDGKKCIVIPIDDNEQANINGISREI